MPTFPAPAPVPVHVDLTVGTVHVVATERDDVVVTVLPADPGKPGDVRAAEDVRVERGADVITITGPRSWKQLIPFSGGTPAVTVEVPTGSDLRGRLTAGRLTTEGTLGVVDMTLSAGDVHVDEVGRLDLRTSAGAVAVGRVTGPASVRASAGTVRIGELLGEGTVRSTAGQVSVGSVTGSLHLSGAHGDMTVGHVRGSVTAKAASGGIRVDRVESGNLTLTTSHGTIEVGVPEGTAAWLDVSSQHGTVRNRLRPADGPVDEEDKAEIHASTGFGDVVVRRP